MTTLPGATLLDPDEAEGLIPRHIISRGQLNAWEQENILEGERWAFARMREDVLTLKFIQELHKKMFGHTWRWAGRFRTTEKNIGVDPIHIRVEIKKLCDDVAYQIKHKSYPIYEIAVRCHHRLTWIHPFPNGNGRHARTFTDVLLVAHGAQRFTWGASDLVAEGDTRDCYISALQAADRGEYRPLIEFVRSGKLQ